MKEVYCENGKLCYDTKEEARNHIVSLSKKTHKKYTTYVCELCGKYHVGSTTKNLKRKNKAGKYPFKVNLKKKKWK